MYVYRTRANSRPFFKYCNLFRSKAVSSEPKFDTSNIKVLNFQKTCFSKIIYFCLTKVNYLFPADLLAPHREYPLYT